MTFYNAAIHPEFPELNSETLKNQLLEDCQKYVKKLKLFLQALGPISLTLDGFSIKMEKYLLCTACWVCNFYMK